MFRRNSSMPAGNWSIRRKSDPDAWQTAGVLDSKSPAATPTNCPDCSAGLIHVDPKVPWCPSCEWNLGAFEPPSDPYIPKRFLRRARRSHRRAYALDTRLFQRLRLSEATRPGITGPRVLLWLASALLLVATIGLTLFGLWLVVRPPWLPGALLILIGIELRPRFARLDRSLGVIARDEAPITYQLLARVAAAMGVPAPSTLYVDSDLNAFCARVGLRRRPVLSLGLPLWGALSPQGRIALLGHEFGHFINGDPRQGLLTQPALTTFGRLAELLDPAGMRFRDRYGRDNAVMRLLGALILAPLSLLCWRIHLFLNGIAGQDSRRAEYLADRMAVQAGGLAAAQELMETLLSVGSIQTMIRRRAATSCEPAEWQAAAAEARAELRARRRLREQRSIRLQTAMLASHPAAGLRIRMVDQHPWTGGEIVITAREWAASDVELRAEFERAGRDLQRS